MRTRRSIVLAGSTIALTACGWRDAEPAVRVIPDPPGQRATTLLDAADTALAHGKPTIARAALVSAYRQPTPSPAIAYRVAQLADRLDDVGTAARAYRRYLALSPDGPVADSVRERLYALVDGPMRDHVGAALAASAAPTTVVAHVESTGEVEDTARADESPSSRSASAVKRHRTPARRHAGRTHRRHSGH